ncbi:MAG: SPFH domain-containing protein [Saprospiraceae bacterium]|nr:SPFH domain-containing protein [Saprospiraceae bacterium]MDW8230728.1 SPFH domain-containing protein [Saprospiraceae bacterium]
MEKTIRPASGWPMLALFVALLLGGIGLIIMKAIWLGILLLVLSLLLIAPGFIAVEPNSSRVLTLFGAYVGSVKESGFFFVNPFFTRKKVSLRAVTFDVPVIKVNDKQGNPIMIGAVVVYRVSDTYKAAFGVEDYHEFAKTQSESAVRKLAGMYSYDNLEDEDAVVTLRTNSDEVNQQLAREIGDRLEIAGIEVIEARINHLAYATEIAGAMLQRQQATAIIAARSKIVEGAVGMVEMALEQLSKKEVVHLDEERKAAMVSNLMVVLCSDKAATPVLNAGTLHH